MVCARRPPSFFLLLEYVASGPGHSASPPARRIQGAAAPLFGLCGLSTFPPLSGTLYLGAFVLPPFSVLAFRVGQRARQC